MKTKKRQLDAGDFYRLSLWRKRNLQLELKALWHLSPPVWALVKGADLTAQSVADHLNWTPDRTTRAITTATQLNLIHRLKNGNLRLVEDRHKVLRRRLLKVEEKKNRTA